MADRIIEVTVAAGRIDYRLWPCSLDTRAYGSILADIAKQLARMIAQEGGFEREEIETEIKRFFDAEWKEPMNTMIGTGQLQ
jgi:Domain of unknown function (DUF5076)